MSAAHTKTTTKEREKKNGNMKSYPAPRELATPTDLKPEEVEKVVETINPLVADAFALFIKTKNFHWHVASSHYRDYHCCWRNRRNLLWNPSILWRNGCGASVGLPSAVSVTLLNCKRSKTRT